LKSFRIPDPTRQNSIQIFPESGELVNNILCKTGFKVLSPTGLGLKAKIKILEDNLTPLMEFETNPLGMGSIPLILNAEKKYIATATFEDGSSVSASIPPIAASGYALTVNSGLKDKIVTQLSATADLVNGQEMYLIAQYHGLVLNGGKEKLNHDDISFNLAIKYLSSTIIHVTILIA